MKLLALNCGSSTLKFDVVDIQGDSDRTPATVATGVIDRVGGAGVARLAVGDVAATRDYRASDHDEAFGIAAQMLDDSGLAEGIEAVGHRVVHGGDRFREPVLIDDAVIDAIEAASELAPLHNAPALAALAASRRHLGPAIPMVATFDTAFYASLPDVAAQYALPRDLTDRFGIRRYGFHGLAHRYMVERFRSLHPEVNNARLITLQLGNGCSATASAGGRAVDTSMGFTPLEGFIMGTRSGDIDPSIPLYIAKKLGMSGEEVESKLNNESGLLGLSGKSNDMRDVLDLQRSGDHPADLAVRAFCYRARKYVGAYLSALGGADAVIFGGGIGEHLPDIRAAICERLEWAGLRIDAEANQAAVGVGSLISLPDSPLRAYVTPVQESIVIAQDTFDCLSNSP